MADVFISYAREDSSFVDRLRSELGAVGFECWVDREAIPPTAEFLEEIYEAIEATDAFVFVLSPESVTSEVCAHELAHAVKHHKRLVPILHRDVGDGAPAVLGKLHWLLFRSDDDFALALQQLTKTVTTDLDRVKRHTRLLVRATEWERRSNESSVLLRGSDLREAEEWLARSGDLEPRSTVLQTQYIIASRRAATGRQRAGLTAAMVALVLVTVFAVAAYVQRNEKERQRQIAFSRQLAAQSELVFDQQAGQLSRATLLAVEAARLLPSTRAHALEVDQALRRGLSLLPIHRQRLPHEMEVKFVSFASEGQLLVTVTPYLVQVWSASDFQQIERVDLDFAVSTVTLAPDGRYLAIGGHEGNVQVLDLETGETLLRRRLEGREVALALSLDGRFAVGGEDGVARVWTLAALDETSSFDAGGAVTALAFSKDGASLAAGRHDGRVRLWDLRDPAEGTDIGLGGPVDAVARITFVDADRLVTLDDGGTLRVWDQLGDRKPTPIVHGARVEAVAALALDGAGVYLATAGSDGRARVWSWQGGQVMEVADLRHEDTVTAVHFSPDGTLVATASADQTGRIWDTKTGREVFRMPHAGPLATVAFGPGAVLAATGGKDGFAHVWELAGEDRRVLGSAGTWSESILSQGGDHLAAVEAGNRVRWWGDLNSELASACCLDHANPISSMQISRDGETLATVSSDRVHVYRRQDREPIALLSGLDRVTAVGLSPDGGVAVLAGVMEAIAGRATAEVQIEVWPLDAPGTKNPLLLEHDGLHEGEVGTVVFSSDGAYLVTAGGRFAFPGGVLQVTPGRALVWAVASLERVATTEHGARVSTAAFSRDGRFLATAGDDDTVEVLSVTADRTVAELRHDDANLVGFSPSGRYVASAGSRRDVRVWEVASGQRTNAGAITHDGNIRDVVFSGDEKFLATASDDGTSRVWDLSSGAEVARILHDARAEHVRFSADDRLLITISGDGVVRRSPWWPDDLVAEACDRLGRNLSWSEWEQYMGETPYQATCATLPIEPAERFAQALALTHSGDRRGASEAFERAVALVQNSPLAQLSNRICWRGALAGFGSIVAAACDHAVALAPEIGDYRDSRGVVHALAGNYSAAIDDFRYYVEWGEGKRALTRLDQRKSWIAKLEDGINPLDAKTLEALLTEVD